jgi:hypothetical protein
MICHKYHSFIKRLLCNFLLVLKHLTVSIQINLQGKESRDTIPLQLLSLPTPTRSIAEALVAANNNMEVLTASTVPKISHTARCRPKPMIYTSSTMETSREALCCMVLALQSGLEPRRSRATQKDIYARP